MRDEVMTPKELTRRSIPVAIAATVGLMTSSPAIVQTSIGLFVVPVTRAFGIGRGPFTLITAASMVLGAALTPLAGQAMDRYGVRRVVLPGIVALAVVQLALAAVPVSVALLAILVLLQGAASCLVTPLAYTKVISLWFSRRRGLVLGTSAAFGIGGGSGVTAVLVGALMAVSGWRLAYAGTGIYLLLFGGGIVWWLLHEPPAVERAEAAGAVPDLPGLTRAEALRTPSFQLVMLLVVTSLGAIGTMMEHGPALLAGRGLHLGTVFLACAAIGSLTGQLISGQLLDRINSPKVGVVFALATLAGAATVLHLGFSAAVVLPAAVVMGLGQGAETGLASYYVSRFCGLRAYGSIFGLVMALVTVSAGIFPAIAGYVFDRTGSYRAVIPIVDLLLAVPPIAILLMPRYQFAAVLVG